MAKVSKDWIVAKLQNTELNQTQVDAINMILNSSYVECPDCGEEVIDNGLALQHHQYFRCRNSESNKRQREFIKGLGF